MMDLAQQFALYADRLRDIAAFGPHYSDNRYDWERFAAVQAVAVELFALAEQKPHDQFEPLSPALLAHVPPFVGGDGAVVDARGRREVLEETGVHCRATALVGIFDSRRCGTRSRHHLYHVQFLCEPVDVAGLGQGSHSHEVLEVDCA